MQTAEKMIQIEMLRNTLVLISPPTASAKARALPDRRYWKPGHGEGGAWIFSPTSRNIQHIIAVFPEAEWDDKSVVLRDTVQAQLETSREMRAQKDKAKGKELTTKDYKFNTEYPPFAHQEHVFALSRDRQEFALFMEMGTGKTRVIIDTACYLRAHGHIDAVLVECPNSIKDTWVEELKLMAPEWSEHEVRVWSAHDKKKDREATELFYSKPNQGEILKWFIVNTEGMGRGERLSGACETFLQLHDCLHVIDESSRIKSPKAKQTRKTIQLGKMANYRRIMTGTPVTQGPLDLYSQFRFLDPHILGFGSFYSFRNRYAVMGGFNNKQVIGYSNLEELIHLMDPYTYRVTRDECIDLPPKVYERLTVELAPAQRRAYNQMKNDMIADMGDQRVTATIVLTQMLRLQQIVGGFLPVMRYDELTELEETWVEAIEGPNAKLDALLDFLADADHTDHVIIWARFRAEIEIIANALADKYGEDAITQFHGGTSTILRTEGRKRFQDPKSPTRFFIGQTETGGLGITLTAANTVIYFSNSFRLESRLQSEDRAHRIGQDKTVTYVDMVAKATLDPKVLGSLRGKKNVADMVTGDNWKEWI